MCNFAPLCQGALAADASSYSAAQVGFHPQCDTGANPATYLGPGICDISCGRCQKCPGYNYCAYCTDNAPSGSNFTCAQQARLPAAPLPEGPARSVAGHKWSQNQPLTPQQLHVDD